MSTYVISDLHGQLGAFENLLEKTSYQPGEDRLFLLGDYVDWGPQSIDLLERIIDMKQSGQQVRCVLGNHDLLMRQVIGNLGIDCELQVDEFMQNLWLRWWEDNDGLATLEQYLTLCSEKKQRIYQFLSDLELYIPNVEVAGRRFYLCHSVPLIQSDPQSIVLLEHLFTRVWEYDFTHFREIYPDDIILCGHTITNYYWQNMLFDCEDDEPSSGSSYAPYVKGDLFRIFHDTELNLISLDCGGKLLGRSLYSKAKLASLRLDDMQVFYSAKSNIS